MSQSSKTIHDFQALNLGQLTLPVTTVTAASATLTPAHSGDIINLNATGGCAITLPAPQAGLVYHFVVNNTGAHTLTAPSACINGSISPAVFNTGANLATSTAKTVVSTTAGSSVGDVLQLTGNGTKYLLQGQVALYDAVKFA